MKIFPNRSFLIFDLIAIVISLLTAASAVYFYQQGGTHIPTHFNIVGQADAYSSSPAIYLILGGLGIFVNLLTRFCARFPQFINIPVLIKSEHLEESNLLKSQLGNIIGLPIGGVMLTVLLSIHHAEQGGGAQPFLYYILAFIAIVLVLCGIYTYKIWAVNRR